MLGLDEWARERGLVPVFLTLTLPPSFHPNPGSGLPYGGLDWADAPSPEGTDKELQERWRALQAWFRKVKESMLGLRVVEPHKDGTPHLHALLYVSDPAMAERLDRQLQAAFPEPVAGERIASKLMVIDRARAAPSTYVMKYILKGLPMSKEAKDGADGKERDGDPCHLTHHDQVATWRSERRMRGFSWVGLNGMRTVWQRVRTMKDDEVATAPESVHAAKRAMDAGQWADALDQLGAMKDGKARRPAIGYQAAANAYGETVKRPATITLGDWSIPLKARPCTVEMAKTTPQDAGQAKASAAAERNAAEMARARQEMDDCISALNVSCPRAGSEAGEEGNPRSTAGPPRHHEAAAAPATPPETHPKLHVTGTHAEQAEQAATPREQGGACPMAERALDARLAKLFEGIPEALEGVDYF